MRIVLTAFVPCLLIGCAADDPAAPARAATDAVATTGLVAVKVPACAATVVVGGLAAGIAALSPDPHAPDVQESVSEGVDHNCGPPYVVTSP
jgi:hypothetical protein